jgi:thiamine biosynthesis protein ThiS
MIKVADKTVAWHEGMTITDLLSEINDPQPYAVVRIDNQYVSRPNFSKTTIPDNAEVFLIQLVVGG